MQSYALLAILATSVALACATQHASAVPSPAEQARCAAVNDSIFTNVSPERLPLARPKGTFVPPRLPSSIAGDGRVTFRFLVRPDGSADVRTVEVTGTDDAAFRRQLESVVTHSEYEPARVAGCPVYGQVAMVVTSLQSR